MVDPISTSTMDDQQDILIKRALVSGPVTCLSLPSPGLCIFGQGAFLNRVELDHDQEGREDIDRLLVFPHGNLHGIRYNHNHSSAAVFGGRQLSLLKNVLLLQYPMQVLTTWKLSDWIYETQFLERDCTKSVQLVVGLAHLSLEVWEIDLDTGQKKCLHAIRENSCPLLTSCISIFSDRATEPKVAVGTVGNEILMWSVSLTDQAQNEAPLERLRGHEGVIHAVQFAKDSDLLVSGSDDRTVRLWKRQLTMTRYEWSLVWTGFGHTARCWDVQFNESSTAVASTGEDGTLRLWGLEAGDPLAVWRGHSCQSIWRVASCGNVVATGGNDGQVALYNVHDRVMTSETQCPSWARTFEVPDDRVVREIIEEEPTEGDEATKKKKIKIDQQILVGMQIYFSHGKPLLLVATRAGSLMTRGVDESDWTIMEPWAVQGELETCVRASSGCCMAVHPSGTTTAIGTKQGDVTIVQLAPAGGDCFRRVLPSREHLAVQKLKWVNGGTDLLAYHVQSMLLWSWNESDAGFQGPAKALTLHMNSKGMAISSSYNEATRFLVAGDTRGSLALFDLGQPSNETTLYPTSVLSRAHGKEHVTDILWVGPDRLFSLGNKGCLLESAVGEDGQLVKLLYMSFPCFTGLELLWEIPNNEGGIGIAVGGYFGNIFSIKDVNKGYEFFRKDTGGRQRSFDIKIDSSSSRGTKCWFAVPVNRKDGRNEIELTCESLHHFLPDITRPCGFSLGFNLHGESIFDACMFSVGGGGKMALLTGSEDCSSRITLIQDGRFASSKILPSQASGVRAVCHSKVASSNRTLAVVGGGQLVLQFFLVDNLGSPTATSLRVAFVGHGKPPEKASIDHRINTVAATPVYTKDNQHAVVAGDSNGGCYLYTLSEERTSPSYTGYLVYRSERPIISLDLAYLESRLILLIGTTGGEITLLDISYSLDLGRGLDEPPVILLRYKPHQMGANAISSQIVVINDNVRLRVCTGGDDQALHCCDIDVRASGEASQASAVIVDSASVKNAAHSAIRGIHWVSETTLVASGYDQRLTLWEVAFPLVRLIACSVADVGDVNSLAFGVTPCGQQYAAVVGAGVELFSLEPTKPNAQ
jgi:WD40 repeat protein